MKKYDLIVAGGCSAGIVAAVNAKRLYPKMKIAVLEKLPRIGKKLLATGNGKCNLTNLHALEHDYTGKEFAEYAMNKYPPKKIIEFFKELGLLCYSDSCGRIYPQSNTAASVVDTLRFELERLGIDVFCDTEVKEIKKSCSFFTVNGEFESKKIILSLGGMSSPSQGSDGSGYPIAASFGHKLTKPVPALVPLCGSPEITKTMKGIRARDASLTLKGEKTIKKTRGEILFTDYGLSGIAAMELASSVQKYIDSVKQNAFTYIDFMPEMTYGEILDYLKNISKTKGFCNMDNLLSGFLPKAVGISICKASKPYSNEKQICELKLDDMKRIAEKIKSFPIEITGTKGFFNSQVTSGGIKTDEINPKTMQSKICNGLYFAGEIIDVDGGCGGFNLQWAWCSGMLAGELND